MPGIYGYIKKQKDENQLINMTNFLLYQDNFLQDEVFSNDYLECSHIHIGNMKKDNIYFFKDGIYISIEGEQYDFNNSFEEFIFDAYTNKCLEEKLNKLDGYFNAVIYDSNINKLFLVSDRYGMRMLYYYYKESNFAFSGEVKGLLGLNFVDKTISQDSFDCFIDLGYLLEDSTWFENIKLIKPATIMEFDLNTKKLSQKYYWKWSEIKQQNVSFEDAVDTVGELFIEAVKKRFSQDEKMRIPLSGGLDSRAIFAAVNHIYPNYKGITLTFGVEGCDDIEIAKLVVKKTNWEHYIFNFTQNNWFEPRKYKVWLTDGMLNMMHMHGAEITMKTNFSLNGFLGDVVFGASYMGDDIQLFNQRINKKIAFSYYKHHISDDYINDTFFDIHHIEPFLALCRGRRFINMGTVNGLYKRDVRKPFFDNKLIEFIYSIPDDYRKGNKLYSSMLLKFFPVFFKDIPWQKTRKNIDGSESAYLKKDNIIRGYMNYADAIREKPILDEIFSILDYKNSYYKNFTDIDAISTYLKPHLENLKVNHIEKIFKFITIELYLNSIHYTKLCDGQKSQTPPFNHIEKKQS